MVDVQKIVQKFRGDDMTKAELEKALQEEQERNTELVRQIEELRNTQPITSGDYASLQERMQFAEQSADYWRQAAEQAKAELTAFKVALSPDTTISKDVLELEKLKAMIDAKEQSIKYFQSIAAGSDPESVPVESRKPGRPTKFGESARKRIMQLRSDGLTIRRIAELEQVSVGTVAAIIKQNE